MNQNANLLAKAPKVRTKQTPVRPAANIKVQLNQQTGQPTMMQQVVQTPGGVNKYVNLLKLHPQRCFEIMLHGWLTTILFFRMVVMSNINGQFTPVLQQNAAQQILANNDKLKSQQQQQQIIQQVLLLISMSFYIFWPQRVCQILGNGKYAAKSISTADRSPIPAPAATIYPATIPEPAHGSIWKYPAGCVATSTTASHSDSHIGSKPAASNAARYSAEFDDKGRASNSATACVVTKRIRSNFDGKHSNRDFNGRIVECWYFELDTWSVDITANPSSTTSKSTSCHDNTLGITDVCWSSEGESRRS